MAALRQRKLEGEHGRSEREREEEPSTGRRPGHPESPRGPALEGHKLPPMAFSLKSPELELVDNEYLPGWAKILYMLTMVSACVYVLVLQKQSTRWSGVTPFMHAIESFRVDPRNLPNLAGKTFVVTGANAGLGNATSSLLASLNATVVMACRDIDRCEKSAASIRSHVRRPVSLSTEQVDLSDLKSVAAFGKRMRGKYQTLDGLCLNAGFIPSRYKLSKDGIEETFAVNHVGNMAVFLELAESLLAETPGVVVSVTSAVHLDVQLEHVPTSLNEVNSPSRFDAMDTYAMTKLANVLFIRELDRRYHDQGIVATAASPGAMKTDLVSRLFQFGGSVDSVSEWQLRIQDLIKDYLFWPPSISALSVVGALTLPMDHGVYTNPIHRAMRPSELAQNNTLASALWDLTTLLIQEHTT